MSGKLISIVLLLIFWGLPLLKGMAKAKVKPLAQNVDDSDEQEEDEMWAESFEEEEPLWDEAAESTYEEPVAESFANYFSYETEQPEVAEKSAPQVAPAPTERLTDSKQGEAFEFDLRQAVIYQTILQNNYLSEWK